MHPRSLPLVLRLVGVACVVPSLLHLVFGVGADRLLDPTLPTSLAALASLDSQNRFYGVVFALYGVLLWLGAADPGRHAPMLRWLIGLFFAGGVARLVSVALVGLPSAAVMSLGMLELVIPPLLWTALSRWIAAQPAT